MSNQNQKLYLVPAADLALNGGRTEGGLVARLGAEAGSVA
jgi:hypothetical protein